MIFDYDYYGRLKQNIIFLANPQKIHIGILFGTKSLKLKRKCFDISELSFNIYKKENGVENVLYDEIEGGRLIEAQYIGWFQIQSVKANNDGLVPYKEVTCLSLENELIGKRIYDINGVYALYDITNKDNSLLHIITKSCGWSIGHIDNDLIGKWRTFSVDSEQIYNLLTTTVSKSFDCVFQFNTFDKTINAYKESNFGNLTDILITYKNLLLNHVIECDFDNVVTKLRVSGADGVDIREVNPTSTDYIINVDYYKKWMSAGLKSAYEAYQVSYNSIILTHTDLLNQLKLKQLELNTLKENLNLLKGNKKAKQEVIDSYLNIYGTIPPAPEYTLYLAALNEYNSYVSSILNKNNEISNKESEIASIQNTLTTLSSSIDANSFFTNEQIKELNLFIKETTEYQDSTFVITDTMSDAEATNVRLELFQNGISELERVSKPQIEFLITAKNLFTLSNKNSKVSLQNWKEHLDVGNYVTIPYEKDSYITVRLLEIDFDFDNLSESELTLSNKDRYDKEGSLSEMLANANRSAKTVSLKEFGYDQASKLTSPIRDFMNGALDATNNAMQSNDNQELLISKYGLWLRKWLDDQNKYSDEQAKWVNNVLLFSDDGFKSAKTGIGKFITPEGESFYGFMGEVIFGDLVASSALTIKNQNNTFIVDKNGAYLENAEFIIYRGGNTIKLNPSDGFEILNHGTQVIWLGANGDANFCGKITSSEIETSKFSATNGKNTLIIDPNTSDSLFTITKNGVKQIYFDADGNAVFNGHMTIGVIYSKNWIDSGGSVDGTEVGTKGTFINLEDGTFHFGGEHIVLTNEYLQCNGMGDYLWMGKNFGEADIYTKIIEGRISLKHKGTGEYDLNITPTGISSTITANENSTCTIDFYSKVYGDSLVGMTLQTYGSPIALKSRFGSVLINPQADATGNDNGLFRFSHSGSSGTLGFGTFGDNNFTGFSGLKFSGNGEDTLLTVLDGSGSLGNLSANELRSKLLKLDTTKIIYDGTKFDINVPMEVNSITIGNSGTLGGKNLATQDWTQTQLDSLEVEYLAEINYWKGQYSSMESDRNYWRSAYYNYQCPTCPTCPECPPVK